MKIITMHLFLGALVLLFGFSFHTASAQANPGPCTSGTLTLAQTKYAITRGGFGEGVILGTRNPANGLVEFDVQTRSGRVQNDTDCALPISVVSYSLDNPADSDARYQTYYSSSPAGTVVPPHSSIVLTISLPPCNFQVDFFYGDSYPRPTGDRYVKSDYFLEAGYILNRASDGGLQCPVASPTPTPTPPPVITPTVHNPPPYYPPPTYPPVYPSPPPQIVYTSYQVQPQMVQLPQYVELAALPYTGLEDYPLLPLYATAFVFWGGVISTYIAYRKIKSRRLA